MNCKVLSRHCRKLPGYHPPTITCPPTTTATYMTGTASSLPKSIGFWAATAIIIGSIIGSGLFMKPAVMAQQLGSPVWLTVVWIIGGAFSLMGALIYAELGAMMPLTGGIYVYFRVMFGDFIAFLYGWAAFSVINTAGVAAIAVVGAEYLNYFLHLPVLPPALVQSWSFHIPFIGTLFPLDNFGVKLLSVFLVVLFTWINFRSTKGSNRLQVFSTAIKIILIAALVGGLFFSGKGTVHHFYEGSIIRSTGTLFAGIVAALTGAFFAYDGWINITFVAGEVKAPRKNIPRSLLVGVLACIIVYVLINQAYLYVMPIDRIALSPLVAVDAFKVVAGQGATAVVAGMIVICALGSVNGNVMSNARVTYALAKDKLFFRWAGVTHPRYETPGNALWLHCIWICLYLISGSFNMLADMFIFISWLCYGLGAAGVILLRKRMPAHERPYKVIGYPWIPLLFVIFTAFYLVVTVWNDVSAYIAHQQPVVNSLLGMLITAMGIPVYLVFKKRYGKLTTTVHQP